MTLRRFFAKRFCLANTLLTRSMFSCRSETEYDLAMTTITGIDSHNKVARERSCIAFGNRLRLVPSTQNQITVILLSSFPSFALSLDHFFTALMALHSFRRPGSNPTELITLNGIVWLLYISNFFVIPEVPPPVIAFFSQSSPRTELIKVDLPTPEFPMTRTFPLLALTSLPKVTVLPRHEYANVNE